VRQAPAAKMAGRREGSREAPYDRWPAAASNAA
jgi:hypothetical protein